ncbi:hypothetical protein [Methylococcus sp. EFPC2]|uniref:hypothetical protein n=1 Tax=Methylococcus sp. EFPC2 TaxID=2812648 RepID=UPI0019678A13|nr:hypothetical protein [Methylococcus sp. EFPC2]QSA98277.1 hypothetical protein JWZ97_05530 [Methylococcus sp. EFPC2]
MNFGPESISRSGLFFRLLRWRLRYYAAATLKLLLRRWQTWLFASLIFSPASMPLAVQIQAAGTPVRKIVEGGSASYSVAAWLTMSLVAVAWTAVQADALRGGAPWGYLRTLPGIAGLETALDFALLLVADLILMLPFVAYGIALAISGGAVSQNAGLALALAVQWPLLQQLVLRGSPAAAIVAATSLFAVLALCSELGHIVAPVLFVAGPLAALRLRDRGTWGTLLKSGSAWQGSRIGERLPPVLNLATIAILALTQWSQLPTRLALVAYVGALTWFGTAWEAIGFQPHVAAGLLLAGLVPVIFQVAGLELTLRAERSPMCPLLAALGIGEGIQLTADLLVLIGGFCLLGVAPIGTLYPLAGVRVFLIVPVGGVAVGLLSLFYAKADGTRFLPKLAVAVAFWLAVWWAVFDY